MCLEHDKEYLYNIYTQWQTIDLNQKGKIPNLNKSKLISTRSEYQSKIDKFDYYLHTSNTTITEKGKLIEKIKPFFRQMCNNLKKYPDLICSSSLTKMMNVMYTLSGFEAEKIESLRQQLGVEITLEEIFEEERFRKELFCTPIKNLIHNSINCNKYTFLGENSTVYISAKGEKYHKKDCPYCKGRKLIPILMSDKRLKDLQPCLCVTKEKRVPNINKEDIPIQEYVSIFIDESVKNRFWEEYYSGYSENHGLFSYIICKGLLTNESQICDENILIKKVTPIPSAKGPDDVTKKAIGEVLFWLLSNGYHENITIYTDNDNAKGTWDKMPENKHLSQYFKSITVCYIPRELNTKADKLGRDKEAYIIPKCVKDVLVSKCKKYDEVRNFLLTNV